MSRQDNDSVKSVESSIEVPVSKVLLERERNLTAQQKKIRGPVMPNKSKERNTTESSEFFN